MFWIKSFARACLDFIISQLFAPIFTTLGGVIMGFQLGVNPFYVYVGAILIFAGTATGLLRFSEIRYRNRVEDKVVFQAVRVSPVVNNFGQMVGVSLGVAINNRAYFPIMFDINDAYSNFDGVSSPKSESIEHPVEVSPGNEGFYDDDQIMFSIKPFGRFEGKIKCKLSYCRKGYKTKYELEINQIVFIDVDSNGCYMRHQSYEHVTR